jgi:tRNA nucleotidyltransferase (CCA-adding enzyme)
MRWHSDLDVTVEGQGIELARAIAERFGGDLTVHEQFGTATVILQHTAHSTQQTHTEGARRLVGSSDRRPVTADEPIADERVVRVDVASCRKETYAESAAYPRVSPGTIRDDLFRRDFTINAMAMAISPDGFGRLVDPFGGARDLRARILRVLHPKSFLDDPSRILRGVRFAQRFHLRMAPGTARALAAALMAGALGRLNEGRVRKELEAMAREPDPSACLEQLAALLDLSGRRTDVGNQKSEVRSQRSEVRREK